MSITLYHHPYSRAANVVWALEELEVPYALEYVDLKAGAQKSPAFLALNSMGKLPTLVDGNVVVSETSAVLMYLGDRYGSGRVAPAFDDAKRGEYLRWCVYPAAVIEPGSIARASKWEFNAGTVGWGNYETMLQTLERGLAGGPWLLGDFFSFADILVGGSLRWMMLFKMMEPHPTFVDYVARLESRPACQRANARNLAVRTEHGLK